MVDRTMTNLPDVPSFSEFDTGGGGAWTKGWYRATITEHTDGQGNTYPRDEESQKGDSRNVRLAFEVYNPETAETRTIYDTINYRSQDFDDTRINEVKEAQARNKGVRGRWDDGDVQRTFLAFQRLGQLEKVLGTTFSRNGTGLSVAPLTGINVDVYLGVNERGFNEVRQVATAGFRVK